MIANNIEAAVAEIINNLHDNNKLIQVILCSSEIEAQKIFSLCQKLGHKFLTENAITYIPGYFQSGILRYESSKKIIASRLAAAHKMQQSFPKIFICSVTGFARIFPMQDWIKANSLELKINNCIDMDTFSRQLAQMTYIQVQRVEEIGEYAIRGSILDLWTPGEGNPSRIEFLDDTIAKIRSFRVEDQCSFKNLDKLTILPAREFVWPATKQLPEAIEDFNLAILSQKIGGNTSAFASN